MCFREGEAKFTVHETNVTISVLFMGPIAILFRKKILKMGPTVLFTHLKIILLQYFQFSVFNFSNNKSNPNEPLVYYETEF